MWNMHVQEAMSLGIKDLLVLPAPPSIGGFCIVEAETKAHGDGLGGKAWGNKILLHFKTIEEVRDFLRTKMN
jgi:hypothetical protein